MSSNNTREIVEKAIHEFWMSDDPDKRLSRMWEISQLIEDTTDDELYELASAVAVEEDPRLRGEICYAISRSQRPNLIRFVKNMSQDKDQYVRSQAVEAIGELDGTNTALIAALNPIMDALDDLKASLNTIQSQLNNISNDSANIMNYHFRNDEFTMNNREKCWETYLRNEKDLLRDYPGKYVLIYNGEIIAIDESDESLAKIMLDKYGEVEYVIYKIEKEEEEPIQISPYVNIIEI